MPREDDRGVEGVRIVHVSSLFPEDWNGGRTQLFLRNGSTSTVRITKVVVDGRALSGWFPSGKQSDDGADSEEKGEEQVLWARLVPDPVPAGGEAELHLQWAKRPEGPIEVALEMSDGQTLQERVLPSRKEPLRLMAIRFAPDRRRVCLYVTNVAEHPLSVERVFLDGMDCTGRTLVGARTLLSAAEPAAKPLREILPGQTKCLVARREGPMRDGGLVLARVVADKGTDAGWARFAASFPFGKEFSEERFRAESLPGTEPILPEGHDSPRFVQLTHCITHHPSKLSESERARAVLAADRRWHEASSATITWVHICRAMLEDGLRRYGTIADSTFTNTNESEVQTAVEEAGDKLETATQRSSRLAAEACAPRPWFQMVMLKPDDRFNEFRGRAPAGPETRARMYWALSAGCLGFRYRGWSGTLARDVLSAVGGVEAEHEQVRDLLACSYPVARGKCDDPKVEVCVLQSGFDALLLLVINHDFRYLLDANIEKVATWQFKQHLTLHAAVPAGFGSRRKAYWLHGAQKEPLETKTEGGQVVISLPRLGQAELILLHCASSSATE